jgi:hypothetical protein
MFLIWIPIPRLREDRFQGSAPLLVALSFLRKQESRVSREGGNIVTFCSSLFSQGQVWIPTYVGMTPLKLCQRINDSGHSYETKSWF